MWVQVFEVSQNFVHASKMQLHTLAGSYLNIITLTSENSKRFAIKWSPKGFKWLKYKHEIFVAQQIIQ